MAALALVGALFLAPSHAAQDGIYGFGSSTVGLSDTAILQRLKLLYSTKLRPLERKCQYHSLQEPALSDAWFDAKPVVMLLGQYSVGKTSFIRYLLGRDFPKQHIGPEPTTDGFLAVMYGEQEKTTPGNALTSQPDTPFHSLRRFGNALLDKLEAVFVAAPILRRITLVDTPGVQAGERQKGRGYDLLAVMKWWAQHADRIVLVFDPFKMSDISSEFRDVIDQLREHQSKVRVVLNKADNVESQKLMRVYGALMWALGSIVCSPEVPRVYIGSFIDEPWVFSGLASLMDAEEMDLVRELDALPEDNVMRKINEIARRASNVKVHVHLLAYMRECVLSKWMGRKQAQEWVCSPEGMRHCYEAVERAHGLSAGDFPSAKRLASRLQDFDFNELYRPSPKRSKSMAQLQELIDDDIPKLIKQLTLLQKRQQKGATARPTFRPVRKRRPYPSDTPEAQQPTSSASATSASRFSGYRSFQRPLKPTTPEEAPSPPPWSRSPHDTASSPSTAPPPPSSAPQQSMPSPPYAPPPPSYTPPLSMPPPQYAPQPMPPSPASDRATTADLTQVAGGVPFADVSSQGLAAMPSAPSPAAAPPPLPQYHASFASHYPPPVPPSIPSPFLPPQADSYAANSLPDYRGTSTAAYDGAPVPQASYTSSTSSYPSADTASVQPVGNFGNTNGVGYGPTTDRMSRAAAEALPRTTVESPDSAQLGDDGSSAESMGNEGESAAGWRETSAPKEPWHNDGAGE